MPKVTDEEAWLLRERIYLAGAYTVSDANSRQEGGSHYRKVPGEQHWDRLVRLFGLPAARCYFIGNITSYVERYQDKNGIEDLKKARHYIDKLIELEENYKLNNSPLRTVGMTGTIPLPKCLRCNGDGWMPAGLGGEYKLVCTDCSGNGYGKGKRVETATHGAEPEPGEFIDNSNS